MILSSALSNIMSNLVGFLSSRRRKPGAEHRRNGQRNDHRNSDCEGQRVAEFLHKLPRDARQKQQGDEHGDQRKADRDDGEADLPRAEQGGVEAVHPALDVAFDVLDHDDGVVDHEAHRDGERHQRNIVDRKSEEPHHDRRADERQRHGDARRNDRRRPPQEKIDDGHDQQDRDQQRALNVGDAGADRLRAVGKHRNLDPRRDPLLQLRQQGLDVVDRLQHIGAGLLEHDAE